MGNSYSVAQEEQEEAEFERLVRAVERAERGSASPELYDLEGQYRHVEAQGRPPRPEKVMAWFKSRRDNHAADPGTQSAPFGPALVQPAAPVFYPGTIAPEHTFPAPWHQAVYQPAPPSLPVQTPPQPGVIYPTIAPTIAILPRPGSVSELSIRSAATADSSESIVVTPSAAIRPSRDDEARDDDSYKHRDPSVGRPPPLAVPVAPVQPIPVQAEHDYTSTVNHASAAVGHPQPITIVTRPGPTIEYISSRTPSPSGSGSRSWEDSIYSRPRSRSRPRPRDSLEDFRDLFYRPTPQHERSPSPDVSRGRSPSRRHAQSERTPHPVVAPPGPEDSEPRVRASYASRNHFGSRSPPRAYREHDRPGSISRSRLRSPLRARRNFRRVNSMDFERVSPSRKPDGDYTYTRPPSRRPSMRSQLGGERRPPSPQDSIVRYPVSTARRSRTPSRPLRHPHRARSRSASPASGRPASSGPKPRSRSPSPLYIRRVVMPSRSGSLCVVRRDPPADPDGEAWGRGWGPGATDYEHDYSQSLPPARRTYQPESSHDVRHEPPPGVSNPSTVGPSYRPPITLFSIERPPSPRPPTASDTSYGDVVPPRPASVASQLSELPLPIIDMPPLLPPQPEASPPVTRSRTPRAAEAPDADGRFEQVLRLYEKTLEDHERRAQLWHEHSTQLVGVVRRLEKHLVALRWHRRASADSLPLSILDEKFGIAADDNDDDGSEKGAGVHLPSALAYTGPTRGRAQANSKPYPSRPYAAGLRPPVRRCSDDWRPKWDVFPLKAFRGPSYTHLRIHAGWDDAALLRELGRSYDELRTVWRKWFSLRSVRSISMVYADHTCVYPRRIGPAGVSPSKNMRLRYFLRHPDQMKGRHEFMQVLTARTDLGIEFVEGWQLTRIAVAILLPVLASLVLAVLYSALCGDVSGAFTIAGYMTSAYSVCLVLLGLLNFVEF